MEHVNADLARAHGPTSSFAVVSDALAREQLAVAAGAIVCVLAALAIGVLGRRSARAGAACITLAIGAVALSASMVARIPGRPPTPVSGPDDLFDVVYVSRVGEHLVYLPAHRRVTLLVVSRLPEPCSLVAPSLGLRADLGPHAERTLTVTIEREGVVRLYASTAWEAGSTAQTTEAAPTSSALLPRRRETLVGWGAELFEQNACRACHSTRAEHGYGPSLVNLAGSYRRLESGHRVLADTRYLAASIIEPEAARAEGFRGRGMPSYAALGPLKIDALVAYLVSLSYLPMRPSLCEAWSETCGASL